MHGGCRCLVARPRWRTIRPDTLNRLACLGLWQSASPVVRWRSACRRSWSRPRGSASPCNLCENAARFNDNASEMFGFGYSLFLQWPRFRLWAQQSDPCQHCRDRGRILQVVPAFAGQTRGGSRLEKQGPFAGRTAQDRQGGSSTGCGGARGETARYPGRQQACRQAGRGCRAACPQGWLQRQVCLGRAPGRARWRLPVAAGQGQTAPRLSLFGPLCLLAHSRGNPANRPHSGPLAIPHPALLCNAARWRRMVDFVQ